MCRAIKSLCESSVNKKNTSSNVTIVECNLNKSFPLVMPGRSQQTIIIMRCEIITRDCSQKMHCFFFIFLSSCALYLAQIITNLTGSMMTEVTERRLTKLYT